MDRAEAIRNLEIMATNLTGEYVSEQSDKRAKYIKKKIDALDMALAALREQEQSKWISVKERLPQEEWEKFTAEKDWDVYPVLAVVAYKRGGSYVTKLFYTGENFVDDECVRYTESVTHWMPLPEPPKEGAEG